MRTELNPTGCHLKGVSHLINAVFVRAPSIQALVLPTRPETREIDAEISNSHKTGQAVV